MHGACIFFHSFVAMLILKNYYTLDFILGASCRMSMHLYKPLYVTKK